MEPRDYNKALSCLPTGIGSMPCGNPVEPTSLVLDQFREIPFWPQLPRLSYRENMYAQFAEHLPGIQFDDDKEKTWLESGIDDLDQQLSRFYEDYLSGEPDRFALAPGHAQGFYEFEFRLRQHLPRRLKMVKGHITGPVSFGLAVPDENDKPILYNETLFDTVVKSLEMNARWQIQRFKRFSDQVMIFLDEPYMTTFGSAFVSLERERTIEIFEAVISAIHEEGGLAGIHCCGNTDWSIILDTSTDLVNFDAYSYFSSFELFPKRLKKFLDRGGWIGWGIVPASDFILNEAPGMLKDRLESHLAALHAKGIDRELLLSRMLLTPSCGAGTLTRSRARMVLVVTTELSNMMRESLP